MDKVRVGIVGSRFAAMLHIHAYHALPHVEVLACAAIDNLKAFQKTHSQGGLSVRAMIEEGRKY